MSSMRRAIDGGSSSLLVVGQRNVKREKGGRVLFGLDLFDRR